MRRLAFYLLEEVSFWQYTISSGWKLAGFWSKVYISDLLNITVVAGCCITTACCMACAQIVRVWVCIQSGQSASCLSSVVAIFECVFATCCVSYDELDVFCTASRCLCKEAAETILCKTLCTACSKTCIQRISFTLLKCTCCW